jgi:uncharacterized membrane protein
VWGCFLFVCLFDVLLLFCLSSYCVPNVASLSGLFVVVLCTQCCQSLWIVCLRLVYPMLPVSLDCQYFIAPSVFSVVYSKSKESIETWRPCNSQLIIKHLLNREDFRFVNFERIVTMTLNKIGR